jgi:hypothetical protein
MNVDLGCACVVCLIAGDRFISENMSHLIGNAQQRVDRTHLRRSPIDPGCHHSCLSSLNAHTPSSTQKSQGQQSKLTHGEAKARQAEKQASLVPESGYKCVELAIAQR